MFLVFAHFMACGTMYKESKSLFYAFLSFGLAILAGDFMLVYLPMSGWFLQAIAVGVYFEYIKTKKTVLIVAIMELLFLASYGGTVAIAAVASIFGPQFLLPVTVTLYFIVVSAVLFFGYLAHYVFRKIRLFDRLNRISHKSTAQPKSQNQ